MTELAVGFDLDLTLFDTRPGIGATWRAVSAESGRFIDADRIVSQIGPPIQDLIAPYVPADEIDDYVAHYRRIYQHHGLAVSPLLPGVRESIAAIRRNHGKVFVLTGKNGHDAKRHIEHAGLDVDEIIGWVWADQKAAAMREHGISVYVGDHPADIAAAHSAGGAGVGVLTGNDTPDTLASADVILASLADFPDWLERHLTELRLAALDAALRSFDSLMVAFSGGADSAFLLAAAVRALGADRVVAATAISPSLPSAELDAARDFAAELGVRHVTPVTDEMARDGYRANAGDRCYFCKAELLDTLGPLADSMRVGAVATGTNADDAVAGFRPGIRAAHERGATTPLRDAGLTKAQIRFTSRQWGLSTWDKPAAACLSSRVAYGIGITPTRLARVEHAESALRAALGKAGVPVRNLRVRDLGDQGAKVEIDAEHIGALTPEILAEVQGFPAVTVDEKGFRSGAMNELLPEPERFR
ncbi:ATP-dependent sacrificial sulfur transferase LarE [Phytomonospora sp. NPDC050363]|uniref:ATP-dependent sacrificial sulfur transferase LarE n=1 Tax=Phytomonospora sp. NPDC050363 TaxID=3155642 RepID=UPI0033F58891